MHVSKTTWISAFVVLGAVILAVALGGRKSVPPESGDARAQVQVIPLQRTRLPGEVRAGGFLRARADVTISAERAGRVVGLPIAEGARVRRGDVIAHLDDGIVTANLERARAVAREAALAPDLPAAELARAQEQLRLAEEELARRHPVSPLAGVVEVQHVDVGEYVPPGTPLVDVIDASVVILDVEVDAEVIGALRPGLEVPVVIAALDPERSRSGTITRLASRASRSTRRFRVEVTLPAEDGSARPGMHAEARFALPAGAPAFYVPKAATRRLRGQRGVFLVENGEARWRPVRVAEIHHRPDLYRVRAEDLEEGALLVVSGFPGLREGALVEASR